MSIWLEISLEIARWAVPLLIIWLAKNRPNSLLGRLSRKILVTRSPVPEIGETESQFFTRYSLWSLTWSLQLLIIDSVCAFLLFPNWNQTIAYQVAFEFMLPMLILLATVGAALLYLRAVFSTFRSSPRIFRLPENQFVTNNGNLGLSERNLR